VVGAIVVNPPGPQVLQVQDLLQTTPASVLHFQAESVTMWVDNLVMDQLELDNVLGKVMGEDRNDVLDFEGNNNK